MRIRDEEPFELNGEVVHRRPCRDCDGCGTLVVCTRHAGYNCPCPGVEVKCDRCRGEGELIDAMCDCSLCALMAEQLADLSETERIRRLAYEATARWASESH